MPQLDDTYYATVVAETNFHGEANVEFQLEIGFEVAENTHRVKVLCFATTCQLLIQNMGGKSKQLQYLNNQHCAAFFAKEFIVAAGDEALKRIPTE